MEEAILSVAKPQNAGLVDTISAGYRAIHRRPWALLIPAGLSTYLWVGQPLALGAAASGLRDGATQAAKLFSDDPALQQDMITRMLSRDVRVAMAWLNMVPVLTPGEIAASTARGVIWIGGMPQLLGAFALINLVALLISSLFLTVLVGAVRGESFDTISAIRLAARAACSIALALLAALGAGLLLGLPLIAISAIIIAALPSAALPIALAWYIAGFWAYVYAGFTPEAVLISRCGPLLAIRNSIGVVRRNMTGTLGLLLLNVLIASGLAVIWRQLAGSPLGAAAAILGSAYVGSGLSAARLEFYREQVGMFREAPPSLTPSSS